MPSELAVCERLPIEAAVRNIFIPRVLGKPDFELTLAGHAIHVGP